MKILVVGISGVSSSGKTTLARHLRDIWPRTFILHEDDFYWPDTQIPVNEDGVQDWDCLESLDLKKLEDCLLHIRKNGASPPDLISKEDQNSVGESEVDSTLVATCHEEAGRLMSGGSDLAIAIIDGFLLYASRMKQIWSLLDVRLFLRADLQTAKARREARHGYVTIEGFWEDPPGYIDNVVWPNYVKDHAFLFKDENVEGMLDPVTCNNLDLRVAPDDALGGMTSCLSWAHSILVQAVSNIPEG